VPDAFGRHVVFPLLRRYLASWPEVQAEVSFADRRTDLVEEGFDLAIRIGGASPDSSLVSRVVARHRAMFVASPAYLAAHREPVDLEEIERHDCLVFSSRDRWRTLRYPGPDGTWISVPGRVRLRLDSAEAIRDAALAGLGIACLPDFLIAQDLAAGRLRRVLGEVALGDLEVFAVYPSRRLLEPRVRRFIDFLVEELAH
jgi:DNA-binding transcriptional LysR family regulator